MGLDHIRNEIEHMRRQILRQRKEIRSLQRAGISTVAADTLLQRMQDKVDGKVTVVDRVAAEMMKRGVSMQAWISHFVIAPPLIIEKQEIDFAVEQLDQSLAIADSAI